MTTKGTQPFHKNVIFAAVTLFAALCLAGTVIAINHLAGRQLAIFYNNFGC